MKLNLQNKIVIVTGGAAGIGQATARQFEAEGSGGTRRLSYCLRCENVTTP